ncbi:MAG: SusC/RagA family TonB-linked outer membrane protein [Ekhidna sp.]|nr:SusC/RagA family TonB-linked outer membrane protein [Ekhidna sp.]
MKSIPLLLGFCFWLITQAVLAQKSEISGFVRDEERRVLIGVTIVLEGTTFGTTTDMNGRYALGIEGDLAGALVFSYTGFETQVVPIENRTSLNIVLRASIDQLDEVVVTAIGIERDKKALGYGVQNVDGTNLTGAREFNVVNSLQGKLSGVQINQAGTGPGGSSKVVIRGFNALGSSNSPLYVIDGIPVSRGQGGGSQFGGIDSGDNISNINPDDIASINVLKGAAAANLYGSRGLNGVIVITTKKGERREGVGIEVNSSVTFEDILISPELQNRFGRGSAGEFPIADDGSIFNGIRESWGVRTREQTEIDGVPIVNWTGNARPYRSEPANFKDFFRKGITYNNAISFSGGNEKTQFRASFSHLDRENIMPNSDFERFNLSLNVGSKLAEKVRVEGRVSYLNQQAFNRPNLTLSPDNPVRSLIEMPRNISLDDLKEFQTADGLPRVYTNTQRPDQWQNPYWAVNLNTNEDERDRIIGFLLLEYRFTDWLKGHVRTGADIYHDFRENKNASNTIYRIPGDGGFYSESNSRVQESNTDVLLTAAKNLSGNLNISTTLGANLFRSRNRSITNVADGLEIPNFFLIQNATATILSEGLSQKEVQSVYGALQFDYKDFLFLELSGRNDWSSSLPSETRSFFYPALSGSLVFTEALSLSWGVVDYGKIRTSIAQVGNDTDPHRLDLLFAVNTLIHNGQSFGQLVPTRPPLGLKAEIKTSFEAGFELAFFKNRLNVDFNYYNAATDEQIFNIPVSNTSGFRTALLNSGRINNRGIELMLSGTPFKAGNFRYDVIINYSRNRSAIEELAPQIETIPLGQGVYDQFGVAILAEQGGEFGDIFATNAFLKDPKTGRRIIDHTGLPVRDPAGQQKIGNFQPDFLAGVSNQISFKNFSLSVLIDIRKGGDIFSFTNAVSAANGGAKFTENDRLEWYFGAGGYVAEGITEDGSVNTVEVDPQVYYGLVGGRGNVFAEEFIYDGSFVKLREMILSYRLPSDFLKSSFLSFLTDLQLAIVGRNLAILHKNTVGFDPEATFNSGNDQGIEAFAFPSTRSIGFNIKMKL